MELEVARKRCKDGLVWAIEQLGGQVDLERLDQIAELIIQTMTGPWRYFHTPEHIFEVGGSVNPIEVLSALFHDLVYVQVDQGVSLNISSYISPFVKEVRGQLVIREAAELPKDPMFDIVAAVFGFVPGQTLSPFTGQNEFLSAVIAGRALSNALPPDLIAQIAACIEATIPFRAKLPSGASSSDMLYQRMSKLNRDCNFGWTPELVADTVRRAVRLANRDVENFAYPNSADFLDNTWNLMPETNHELSNATSYTVRGYRKSLQKMEGFMNFLHPELVFQQFMGEPDEATYQQLVSRTAKNLAVAKLYLGSKLVAIAVVEALSYRLGRDLPLSTMMGELPGSGVQIESLETFLPDIPLAYPPETALESEVLELLNKGRTRDSSYDLKNSPISTFIIKSMGFDGVRNLLPPAKDFFAGTISDREFLSKCSPEMVAAIAHGVVQVFESRKLALREFSLPAKVG